MTRHRILVIDDDPLFRSLLTSMLPRECHVTTASDGHEGYYKALEHPPHLAIIDIRMPGWDGLRTLKAFRAQPALTRVPLMVMTGDASRQTVAAAREAGADDYVLKTTLTREDFLEKVHALLRGERRLKDSLADDHADEITSNPPVATLKTDELILEFLPPPDGRAAAPGALPSPPREVLAELRD